MASARYIVFQVVTALLFLLFMFASIMKLTPALNEELHNEMKGNFRAYSRVFPLSSFGFRPDPDLYRMCVACTELVCALLLYLGNRTANHLVNFIIFGIMIGAIYTHYALGEPLEKMGGAMIGLTLVTVRIFLMGCGTSTEIKVKIG